MSVFPPSNDVGSVATYSANNGATTFTIPANPTDVATIYGSASKTVEILKVFAFATFSTDYWTKAYLIKRSAVNTGGTSAAMANITKMDSTNPAATATPLQYTANPSALGAGSILFQTRVGFHPQTYYDMGMPNPQCAIFDFEKDNYGQPIVLRGVAEGLALNLNGVSQFSTAFSVGFLWREK